MSEPEQQQPTKTYRGNCHCGAFVFEVEAPEIVSVGDCNCSICSKRGYLWLVAKKPLTIVKDEGKLVHYSFGSKTMDHQVSRNGRGLAISHLGQVGLADKARGQVLRQLWHHRHGYW